uniref:ferroxidase n=1 Tax=Anopheles atroparvus TaxID=41427 RepID=A0AAG5D1B5_ANOAO
MYIILRHMLAAQAGRMSTANLVERFCYRVLPSVCKGCTETTYKPALTLQPRAAFPSAHRWYSSMNPNDFIATSLIDSVTFETVCSDTLESLCDYFEELIDATPALKSADVTFGDGVLTVKFGPPHGTYVINRQSPNRQIWLSSPTSGPKRYDFVPDKRTINEGYWLYRHDGVNLHQLLQEEISAITGRKLDFFALPHSQRPKNV